MANFSYGKPGINDAVRRSLDGSFLSLQNLSSPYSTQFKGSSPYVRLAPETVFDKMQTQRTTYTVTAADLQSPYVSGQFSVNWDDPFADTNYTVVCTVEDPSYSPPYAVVLVGPIQKTRSGVVGWLTFPAGMGQPGHVLTIHVLAIHD